MNPKHVKPFLSALGGKVSDLSTKKWVQCSCVFAPWKHDGGVDNHPSSGMIIKEGEETRYSCFTCKSKGTPDQIYHEIKHLNSKSKRINLDKKKIMMLLADDYNPMFDFDIPDYETEIKKTPNKLEPFSENWYNSFKEGWKHPYIKQRDLDVQLCRKLNVRYDSMFKRILFPVRDWSGVLMGVHGRAVDDNDLRYFAYPKNGLKGGKRNPDIWMGENHVDLDQPVILVEGQFDYAKVLLHYDNVLAGLTTNVQSAKLKRISAASEIITIFDHGVGGDAGRDLIKTTFNTIPVQHLFVPKKYGDLGNTPDDLVYELLAYVD